MSDVPIRFSARLLGLPSYVFGRLNAMKLERRRAGIDVIDLGMGNPNDPPPPPIVEKLIEAVQDPRNHRYSVSADGLFNLKREIARYYKKHWDVELDPGEEVVCTIGSKEGLSHLLLALVESGDVALVPSPAFPVHIHGVRLAGGTVLSVPLAEGPELYENIVRHVGEVCPPPKLMILNFPHNPTSLTVDLGFFEKVVAFAREHGILVIHDFAYAKLTFDGYRAPSILQVEGAKDICVEFTTMSKSFNMAGWRVGICAGNSEVVKALAKIKGYYDYGIFMPVQIASIIALRECDEYVERQAKVYERRRDVLCEGLARAGWPVEKPRGGMFVWAALPESCRGMSSLDFSLKMIEEANVAVAPGSAFGELGEGHVRMALVENELRLKQAARQIGRALGTRPKQKGRKRRPQSKSGNSGRTKRGSE
jgi:alanine-synthesizing transaminase